MVKALHDICTLMGKVGRPFQRAIQVETKGAGRGGGGGQEGASKIRSTVAASEPTERSAMGGRGGRGWGGGGGGGGRCGACGETTE